MNPPPPISPGVGGAEGGGPWNDPPISPGVGGAEGGGPWNDPPISPGGRGRRRWRALE